MHNASDLSTLLQALYAAPLNVAGWQPLAELLARHHGGHSGFVGIRDAHGGPGLCLSSTANMRSEIAVAYRAAGYRKDLLRDQGVARPGQALGLDDVISEDAYVRSEFYNECCRPIGIFHNLGFFAPLDHNGTLGILGVHRARPLGYFDRDAKRRMTQLIPHVVQALQLHQKLQHAEMARLVSLNALEALQLGVLVVDDSSLVLFASTTAEALIRNQRELTLRHGRLHLRDPDRQVTLEEAVRAATRLGIGQTPRHDGLFSVGTPGIPGLSLQVYPAPPGLIAGAPSCPTAFVFLSAPGSIPASLQRRLCALYELTPMEGRLAAAIVAGDSLVEFCAQAGISINTAKTYMKRLFAKTGHRRQSHFVRDALANPILRMVVPNTTRSG